jgi:TatD DNase family protein
MQRQVAVLGEILRAVEQHPAAMPILHWWRGSRAETLRAPELGCLFSLNGHEAQSPKVIELIPLDRVITETDFPHSRRYDRAADRPGAVSTPESLLGQHHGVSRSYLRVQLWLTPARLLEAAPRSAVSADMQENIHQARAALL